MSSKFLLLPLISVIGVMLLWEIGCAETISQREALFSEEESHKIAEKFILNSPTFKFDGIDDTLKLVKSKALEKPDSWEFNFEFQCRHAGYGDRTGKILAQVITSHKAAIIVQRGEVTHAVLDDKWDMIKQKMYKEGLSSKGQ